MVGFEGVPYFLCGHYYISKDITCQQDSLGCIFDGIFPVVSWKLKVIKTRKFLQWWITGMCAGSGSVGSALSALPRSTHITLWKHRHCTSRQDNSKRDNNFIERFICSCSAYKSYASSNVCRLLRFAAQKHSCSTAFLFLAHSIMEDDIIHQIMNFLGITKSIVCHNI